MKLEIESRYSRYGKVSLTFLYWTILLPQIIMKKKQHFAFYDNNLNPALYFAVSGEYKK